jgi:hypothetical protein
MDDDRAMVSQTAIETRSSVGASSRLALVAKTSRDTERNYIFRQRSKSRLLHDLAWGDGPRTLPDFLSMVIRV